jgi:hypothetical protein
LRRKPEYLPLFSVNQDGCCLPRVEKDKSSVLGLISSQCDHLWEKQKSQLPQFPNMSRKGLAFYLQQVPHCKQMKDALRAAIFLFIMTLSSVITKALKCLMWLPRSSSSQSLLERG